MKTATMKTKAILLHPLEVQALLRGATQVRRVVKPQPIWLGDPMNLPQSDLWGDGCDGALVKCPFGAPGDELLVRETWWTYPHQITNKLLREGADTWPFVNGEPCDYDADPGAADMKDFGWVRRSATSMPSRFARLHRRIEDIRVQRLGDISEEDAIASGMDGNYVKRGPNGKTIAVSEHGGYTPIEQYRMFWDSISPKHPWSNNDWIWALTLSRLEVGQ